MRACEPYSEKRDLVPIRSSLKTYHHIGRGWSGRAPGDVDHGCSVLRLCLVCPSSMLPSESFPPEVVSTKHPIAKRVL